MVARAGRALLAGLAFLAAGEAGAAGPGLVALEIKGRPIAEFRIGQPQTQFGALEFLGGLELVSANRDFGALSGIDFASDGTLYAVADSGFWLKARLVEEEGRPVSLDGAMIGPMLGTDGDPLIGKRNSDAEGLRIARRPGGDVALVSFEQTAGLTAFGMPDFATATPKRIALPGFVSNLRRNQGLEALAVAPPGGRLAGATVAIAERSLDAGGNHRGFILDGPQAGPFVLRRIGSFDVTDAAFLPGGDLLVLERRFDFSHGLGMRIRRIPAGTIRRGATVDGDTLLEADQHYQIDNMEGLAIRTGASGDTVITLVSDDNHNILQRTLLLQFRLGPGRAASP